LKADKQSGTHKIAARERVKVANKKHFQRKPPLPEPEVLFRKPQTQQSSMTIKLDDSQINDKTSRFLKNTTAVRASREIPISGTAHRMATTVEMKAEHQP
jgi:hypothetical protein